MISQSIEIIKLLEIPNLKQQYSFSLFMLFETECNPKPLTNNKIEHFTKGNL